MRRITLPRVFIALCLLFLPLLVLPRPLMLGEAFLPADLLRYLSPWKAVLPPVEDAPAWNVLRYDGIGQFYPWRLQAARSMRAGTIPLWNPHQMGAEGGTPLLANSQSAPLYPLNALFYILPVWRAFGIVAALHLLIAAAGMYLFLRALPVGRLPALLGAAVFALSGPVVTWLALPTFLAVSCWLPLLLWLIGHAHRAAGARSRRLAAVGAGGVTGMLLLAGHLQVAFYCLLAAGLYTLWLGVPAMRQRTVRPISWLMAVCIAGTIGVSLAAVQVVPSLEVSRISHRAAPPTWNGYRMYSANALPPRGLVGLLAPDFFGHPNAGTYWNTVNYSEWTSYVGVLPLLLAVYAVALPWRRSGTAPLPRDRGYLAGLAALSLLMALGTPVNVPFVFAVPGFAQTGSPARSLILFAFAAAGLAALGLEALRRQESAARGALLAAIGAPLLVAAIGASAATQFASENIRTPFGDLMALAMPGLMQAILLLALGAAALVVVPRLSEERRTVGMGICVALAAVDLWAWGSGFAPSSPPEAVYPTTPGIEWLQRNADDALIAPINRNWSLSALPPRNAVLPPNALTVYGLHDLSGYDSLLTRASKDRVQAAGNEMPSPPENGNMVFIKSVAAAKALGARYLVFAPETAATAQSDATLRTVYSGADMVILENPAGGNWQPPRLQATAYRVGLFVALAGLAALVAGVVAAALRRA